MNIAFFKTAQGYYSVDITGEVILSNQKSLPIAGIEEVADNQRQQFEGRVYGSSPQTAIRFSGDAALIVRYAFYLTGFIDANIEIEVVDHPKKSGVLDLTTFWDTDKFVEACVIHQESD